LSHKSGVDASNVKELTIDDNVVIFAFMPVPFSVSHSETKIFSVIEIFSEQVKNFKLINFIKI